MLFKGVLTVILTQSISWLWLILSTLLPSVQLLAVPVPPPLSWLSLVRGVPPSEVLTPLWGAVPSRLPVRLPVRLPLLSSVGAMYMAPASIGPAMAAWFWMTRE